MIYIDFKDKRPLYEQVVERFKELIAKGVLSTDEQLPSVRSLAIDLSINPNTIQRAYAELEREGLTYTVKGRGSFVSPDNNLIQIKKEELLQTLADIAKESRILGLRKQDLIDVILINFEEGKPYDNSNEHK